MITILAYAVRCCPPSWAKVLLHLACYLDPSCAILAQPWVTLEADLAHACPPGGALLRCWPSWLLPGNTLKRTCDILVANLHLLGHCYHSLPRSFQIHLCDGHSALCCRSCFPPPGQMFCYILLASLAHPGQSWPNLGSSGWLI